MADDVAADELRFHKLIDEAQFEIHKRASEQAELIPFAYDVLASLAAQNPRPHADVLDILADLQAYGRTNAERNYLRMRLLMRLMRSVEAYYAHEYLRERYEHSQRDRNLSG